MNPGSCKHLIVHTLRVTAILSLLDILGCSAQSTSSADYTRATPYEQSAAATQNIQRLNELLERRTHDIDSRSDFPLGPGDVLEISVPLEELEHREFRVASDNAIRLPLVGVMSVKGMKEEDLTNALRQRLSVYMHNPPVALFVKSYGSRQVAVTGAVEKPGLYSLTSSSESLMDVIGRAGGRTSEAAARVLFVPTTSGTSVNNSILTSTAEPSDIDHQDSLASFKAIRHITRDRVESSKPDQRVMENGPGLDRATANLNSITIEINNPVMQQYLNIPARPGDVLIIPASGEVTVGGWVQSPGAYKITPGMTVLSAINAAGGPLFSSTATVLRTDFGGQRIGIPLSISAVQKGQQADVPVQSGDVVMMDRSAAGAVPYAFYEAFSKFGTGMYLPVP
jgi:protein involved in polysaccharide export with SLBB domain